MDAVARHARVDGDDRLLVRWSEPLPDGARLVARHAASGAERAAAVTGDSVTLPAGDLAAGVWNVLIELPGREAVPLPTDDPGFSLDGLLAYAAVPRDRAVRASRSAVGGGVALTVEDVAPHAEVEAVHPRDGEVRIRGRLAYGGDVPGGARLVAIAREGAGMLVEHARTEGPRFEAAFAVEAFGGAASTLWDLWLDAADLHARLATRLDDAPGKRGKLSFPKQTAGGGDRRATVRPYYTARDELSIACHPVEPVTAGAAR